MSARTTIRVSSATRHRLARLRNSPREPYDHVVNRALDLVEEEDREIAPEFAAELAAAIREVKTGRLYATGEIIRELGL